MDQDFGRTETLKATGKYPPVTVAPLLSRRWSDESGVSELIAGFIWTIGYQSSEEARAAPIVAIYSL
jgi:hypothetical protein